MSSKTQTSIFALVLFALLVPLGMHQSFADDKEDRMKFIGKWGNFASEMEFKDSGAYYSRGKEYGTWKIEKGKLLRRFPGDKTDKIATYRFDKDDILYLTETGASEVEYFKKK